MADINLAGNGFAAYENVAGAKTLDQGDCGVVQNVTATAAVTLPATATTMNFIIRVGAVGITVTITPSTGDQFMGGGLTAADNKSLYFTNQPVGSFIKLAYASADGYVVTESQGTFTRQS